MATPKQAGIPRWIWGSLWVVGGVVLAAIVAMAFGHNAFQHMGMHMGPGN